MIKFTEYKDLVKDYKKNKKLYKTANKLENKPNCTESEYKRAEALLKESDEFEKNVLARKTFEILVKLNPFVRERRTNSFFHFKDIYGEDFDALESDSMRIAMIQYLEIHGAVYPLSEQVEGADGDIIDVEGHEPCSIGYETPIWKDGKVVDYGYNCGVPRNYFDQLPKEVRIEQSDMWRAMSDDKAEEWMKNKSWKTLVDKYIK